MGDCIVKVCDLAFAAVRDGDEEVRCRVVRDTITFFSVILRPRSPMDIIGNGKAKSPYTDF